MQLFVRSVPPVRISEDGLCFVDAPDGTIYVGTTATAEAFAEAVLDAVVQWKRSQRGKSVAPFTKVNSPE